MKILLTLPVYNEEDKLENSVKKIIEFFAVNIEDNWSLLIADNASTDNTGKIGKALAEDNEKVFYKHIEKKGRGGALRKVWLDEEADIYAYCDIDLATDLAHFTDLFGAIKSGAGVAIGARYNADSESHRSLFRLVISKGYNLLLRLAFNTRIKDFQCGFKAVSREVVERIVAKTEDNEWFFDTEMILLAEKLGYKVAEIPVNWQEQARSKVDFIPTIIKHLKDIFFFRQRLKNIK